MSDSLSSTLLLPPYSSITPPNSRFTTRSFIPTTLRSRNGGSQFINSCLRSNETGSVKTSQTPIPSGSGQFDFYEELGFKEKEKENNGRINDAKSVGRLTGEDLVGTEEGFDGVGSELRELEKCVGGTIGVRKGRQLMKRSNMVAKQVISMETALGLGFVSQLWVDTVSWVVLVVEVRPNLLSGELERFFLEDVSQVGDVVLIQDESVMENELKMAGLETLVGYNVVTPGRQSIGKVRGYTFNINSGAVESLELDSFGISTIPSSLVSTYALLVEDVLEVVSDTVVVHEAAASRIQRLTKGFWGSQKLGNSIDELGEHSGLERQPVQLDNDRSRRRSFNSRKLHPKTRETVDDWELPMDYL